jgi:hypothetical protein
MRLFAGSFAMYAGVDRQSEEARHKAVDRSQGGSEGYADCPARARFVFCFLTLIPQSWSPTESFSRSLVNAEQLDQDLLSAAAEIEEVQSNLRRARSELATLEKEMSEVQVRLLILFPLGIVPSPVLNNRTLPSFPLRLTEPLSDRRRPSQVRAGHARPVR